MMKSADETVPPPHLLPHPYPFYKSGLFDQTKNLKTPHFDLFWLKLYAPEHFFQGQNGFIGWTDPILWGVGFITFFDISKRLAMSK